MFVVGCCFIVIDAGMGIVVDICQRTITDISFMFHWKYNNALFAIFYCHLTILIFVGSRIKMGSIFLLFISVYLLFHFEALLPIGIVGFLKYQFLLIAAFNSSNKAFTVN